MKSKPKSCMSAARNAIHHVHPRGCAGVKHAAVFTPAAAKNIPRADRLVVPFAAGGVSDITGRVLGSPCRKHSVRDSYRQSRRGGVMMAPTSLPRPRPRLYLVRRATSPCFVPHLYKKVPYDPIKDFAPIGMVSVSAQVLGVNKTSNNR